MWPLNFVSSLKDRKQHCAAQRPSRAAVTLNLEALEERWLPNGAMTSAAPPSFSQAAIALFNDGVNLGQGLVNQFVFRFDQNTAYPVPLADLNADIAFNSPYVGSFAPFFVMAGEVVGAQVQFQVQSVIIQSDY